MEDRKEFEMTENESSKKRTLDKVDRTIKAMDHLEQVGPSLTGEDLKKRIDDFDKRQHERWKDRFVD